MPCVLGSKAFTASLRQTSQAAPLLLFGLSTGTRYVQCTGKHVCVACCAAAVHPAHEPPASSPHSKRQSTGHRKQQHHQTSKEQLTHKSLTTTPQPDDETTASGPFSTAQLSRMRRLLTPVDTYHSASGSVLQDAMQLPAAAGMTTAVTAGGITQLVPHYVVDESHGRPPVRPQLCGPGLVCTGDVEPLPHTCVKVRPPNTCFQVSR